MLLKVKSLVTNLFDVIPSVSFNCEHIVPVVVGSVALSVCNEKFIFSFDITFTESNASALLFFALIT